MLDKLDAARAPLVADPAIARGAAPSSAAASTSAELITICVPTYRRPSQLLAALVSCFAQHYRPLEIDVSDDSPSDDTEALIATLLLPEGITLRYRRNTPGLGQAANVNALFAAARGHRLLLLHDDDVLLAGAIGALDELWRSSDAIVAAYGMQQIINENGETSRRDTDIHNGHANRLPAFAGVHDDIVVRALWRQFPNDGYLVSTAAAVATGYRSFAEIGDACDADFGLRLALAFRGRQFALLDRMTTQYRLNAGSLRNSNDISWKLYGYLEALGTLSPSEDQAREELLAKIAAKATLEHAFHGRRKAALRIFFSPYYPRDHGWRKSLYHLSTIMLPHIATALRKLSRS